MSPSSATCLQVLALTYTSQMPGRQPSICGIASIQMAQMPKIVGEHPAGISDLQHSPVRSVTEEAQEGTDGLPDTDPPSPVPASQDASMLDTVEPARSAVQQAEPQMNRLQASHQLGRMDTMASALQEAISMIQQLIPTPVATRIADALKQQALIIAELVVAAKLEQQLASRRQ